jgi:NADH-quinone oxidoreductase subunit K
MLFARWLEHTDTYADFIFNSGLKQTHPYYYIVFLLIVATCGLVGLGFFSSNALSAIIFGEVLFVGLVAAFTICGRLLGYSNGPLYSLIILTIAAIETSVGMVLILTVFKVKSSIEYESLQQLRN